MMKKAIKHAAAGSLILSMALGLAGAVSAETAPTDTGKMQVQLLAKPGTEDVMAYPKQATFMIDSATHERNYLKLLIKVYAPDNGQAWTTALEERKQVEQQMPKTTMLFQSLGEPGDKGTALEDTLKPANEKELSSDAVINQIEAGTAVTGAEGKDRIMIRRFSKDGEDKKMLPLGDKFQSDILKGDPLPFELPPELKLQTDLDKAVEANDEKAIKELLPKLLEDYQKTTADLKKLVEQMKQKPAEPSQSGK